jgi:hypothetical protein
MKLATSTLECLIFNPLARPPTDSLNRLTSCLALGLHTPYCLDGCQRLGLQIAPATGILPSWPSLQLDLAILVPGADTVLGTNVNVSTTKPLARVIHALAFIPTKLYSPSFMDFRPFPLHQFPKASRVMLPAMPVQDWNRVRPVPGLVIF